VIDRAEARVPEQERAVTALLAALEQREAELDARSAQLEVDETDARDRGRRIAERETTVRERERALERRGHAEARQFLLDARAELERNIAAVRAAAESGRADAERGARRALERTAESHADALATLDAEERAAAVGPADAPTGPPDVGHVVEVGTLGGRLGRVVALRGDEAVVAVGAVKLTVPLRSLRRSARQAEVAVTIAGDTPEPEVHTEIDVRGVRVSDVGDLVAAAVDSAVRADLKSMRVIHGKGTGALRERVAELLDGDPRVRGYRLGAWNEGGAGVTVIDFA
jgi:DNA mismatch repair protein MutS2